MYISTRGNFPKVQAAEAIKLGMVPAGGLFVPEAIPVLTLNDILSFTGLSYQAIAERIIGLYLTDYTPDEVSQCVRNAYNAVSFDSEPIVPLHKLEDGSYIMELWHGPTAAFKDIALQILPHLLSLALNKVGADKEIVILVATSGDTGKAALEGFKNVPGMSIIVFFPHGGVSKVQEMQMTTTDGNNTHVVAVRGNFDDCQNAVKTIFGDRDYNQELNGRGFELSSANSINWGRLLPQIVYYFSTYATMVREQQIKAGEKINFVVPTGNFGNILAGYYAYRMGLPINRLICASNENKVLTDFFNTGVYDRNRQFMVTNSPSMDILISSNLERFLFEVTNHDGEKVSSWFASLNATGRFEVDAATKQAMDQILTAGFATARDTLNTIKTVFARDGYTLDTHTAVGVKVYGDYQAASGDQTKTVVEATANPYKFNSSVLEAISGEGALQHKDEFQILEELRQVTGMPIHPGLSGLDEKPVRHSQVCDKNEIKGVVSQILKLK
ncbi:MAG TPA: threonine synthase [Bacillota bacterium]|nr:threonine synthase [Bacillota bacterium]